MKSTSPFGLRTAAGLLTMLLLVAGQPAAAFESEEEAREYYRTLASERPGVVDWGVLADLDITIETPAPLQTVATISYSRQIRALDGQTVMLQGYIFPLEAKERHGRFLLSSIPRNCPFCLPGGPMDLVEVLADEPVAYTEQPVLISGVFHVLDDDDTGLYYRMTAARQVE